MEDGIVANEWVMVEGVFETEVEVGDGVVLDVEGEEELCYLVTQLPILIQRVARLRQWTF